MGINRKGHEREAWGPRNELHLILGGGYIHAKLELLTSYWCTSLYLSYTLIKKKKKTSKNVKRIK